MYFITKTTCLHQNQIFGIYRKTTCFYRILCNSLSSSSVTCLHRNSILHFSLLHPFIFRVNLNELKFDFILQLPVLDIKGKHGESWDNNEL